MGQKVIPTSLRLNKKKNWHSQWVIDKNNYSDLLHFDLEVRKYFETIFNNTKIKVLKISIYKISKNILIYIYLQKQPFFRYKIKHQNIVKTLNSFLKEQYNIKIFIIPCSLKFIHLKKKIGRVFRFLKKNYSLNFKLKKIIYIFSYALYTRNFNLISKFLKENLQKKKIHKGFIFFINKILIEFFKLHSNFLGYRLQVKGRINGAKRKRKMVFQQGKVPLNTLKHNIHYTFDEFKTPSGVCSIKIWFFLKT